MSGWNRPEENTLGHILGGRPRAGVPASSTGGRAVVQASAHGASLGTGHLGMGAGVIAALASVYGLAVFGSNLADYPTIVPIVFAWLLFIVAFATVSLTVVTRGERFPAPLFVLYLLALAAVVALDFVSIWPLGNIGGYASASVAVGFGLLMGVTLRPAFELIAASVVLMTAFVIAILLTTPLAAQNLPQQIITVSLAGFPPLFGVFVVQRFRRMVQLGLDRVLVQSTVSAPRFAVGMLASEELARLDLAAEELLDSVSSGRTELPLAPKTASTAASLATELRLHLIEGRRETWLYHAITESEQLGKSATLTDPGSLAGPLGPHQRDGLLAAVWLLVADNNLKKTHVTARLLVGPASTPSATGRLINVPIVIETTGISRSSVDQSIWAALSKVGLYNVFADTQSLRVEVECLVTNPADQ